MSDDLKEEQKQQKVDSELKKSDSSDEAKSKSHGEILKDQIIEGQEIYDRSSGSIFLSSFSAGLEIGFTYLLLCTLFYFLTGIVAEKVIFKMLAFVYPFGFLMVVLGQSILFTEQTSLLSLPVLNKKQSIWNLLKLWGVVILGNLIGGYLMALVLIWIGPKLHIFDMQTVEKIAVHVTDADSFTIFISAILAGWLMGLLSWLITSFKDSVSRILVIFGITATMSFTGLHHSIIGNIEVFAGLISTPKVVLSDYLTFQSLALFGNAVGGAVFVALLKYRAFIVNIGVD
ncbi:Formate/nitrite transporter FocA, FNT family [Salegentibacter echinorum]|uniref:Formate/nitrite transporter FocA, FNT family n=1 Tax=Salegentibacter echinorum TaxID=1073325 RepID=A0A1M5C6E3_SALEC|nr:formate/nitrite transporter family protein [Salegentibacter echinorum]SHF50177.1 Formate/nitrite transporter FocA, FNT family [Salegentibacter echinorum]